MAVVVAVQALAQEEHDNEFINHGGNADLEELGVSAIAVREMCRRDVVAGRLRPWGVGRAWLRGLVGPLV